MFFALQVDRGNLSQAVSDNMLDQLHLSTNRKPHSSLSSSDYFPFSKVQNANSQNPNRIQLGQHHLPHILPSSRSAFPTRVQENRTRPMDSYTDDTLVHRCDVASVSIWQEKLLLVPSSSRHPRG
jgi:hypothetical protein